MFNMDAFFKTKQLPEEEVVLLVVEEEGVAEVAEEGGEDDHVKHQMSTCSMEGPLNYSGFQNYIKWEFYTFSSCLESPSHVCLHQVNSGNLKAIFSCHSWWVKSELSVKGLNSSYTSFRKSL